MVESDYPHADSSWPDTQRVLAETWGALPDDELRAVAGGNAAGCSATRCRRPTTGARPRRDRLGERSRAAPAARRADRRRRRPRRRARWRPGRDCPTTIRPRISAGRGRATSTSWSADTEILAVPLGNLARPGSTFDDPAVVPTAGRGAARRLGPGGAAGRHGRRGHRPGRAVPDHRAVLLRRSTTPPRAVRAGRGLQRLAGRLLRRRPAPAVRGGHAARCRTRAAAARRAAAGGGRARLRGRLRPAQPVPRAVRCRDRAYDAVWDAAEELDVPDRDPRGQLGHRADARLRPPLQPARAPRRVAPVRGDARLRRSSSRSGCWSDTRDCAASSSSPPAAGCPFWLERLDEQAESFGGFCPDMALRPSEYFARQCAVSFEVDERTLPALAPFVGADAHRLGQRLPAPRRHLPRRRRRHPCHRGPLPDRGPGPRARAQRPAALPPPVAPRRPGRDHRRLLRGGHRAGRRHAARPLRSRRRRSTSTATVARGHDDILAYYTEHTFAFEDFRPDPGTAAGGRDDGDGGHRRPPRRRRPHRCATSSRPTASRSPRSASGDSPTPCGPPDLAGLSRAKR